MRYILFLILLLAGPPARGLSGKYPIRNFTPVEYKAGIQNIDFAQNRDMAIFVANNLGVLSFNGNTWKRHDFKTGKKKRSLAFDETTNRLYVGSQGEFGFFEEDWRYVSLVDKVPRGFRDFDEVWDVFLANSNVYFCTFQGIYVYDGQSIAVIEREGGLERSFLANGKVFTQSQEGKLFQVDGMKLAHTHPQGQAGAVVAGLIPQEEGYLLIYNSGQVEWTTPLGVSRKYDALSRALQGTYVNHVLQLSDTRLVIATQTAGLFLFDLQEEALERITKRDGLGSNACLRSFQDYYGNLWVGMQNGVALIHIHSPMRFLNREIGIQGSGYEVFETEAGMYFTTSNGIYFLGKNADQGVFLPGTEGPAYGMQEIAGKLYAGHHTGLFLLENGRARHIAHTDGLWQVKQLRLQPEFVIGGAYSGLYLFRIDEQQRLQAVQKIRGFNASSRFFEEGPLGRIWVGQYYKGLYRLTLSEGLGDVTVENVSENANSPIKEQIVLSRVADGLYLATSSGVYQLDPADGSVKEAKAFSGPIGKQAVYLLAQDQKNNVHIIAENVVALFRQVSASNYVFTPSSLYELRYYLNNDLLHASMNTSHGIFYSANEGFIHYDPALEAPSKAEKPLLVSRVLSVTEGRALYARQPFEPKPETYGRLQIGLSARVLKIDVESFQFNSVGNQQFRYFLKGLDEDFGEWTTAATKEYTNLKEGDYEFQVQTRNSLGEITTGPTLYLTVHPPFYRSPLALFLYMVLGGVALFMGFRLQRSRYKRKAAQIEQAGQLQLEKEQQKLAEVEREKEQELLRLKEERMASELQHVNNLLAASTMNLVVKNEFIEGIKEELQAVKQKDRNRETKQALEKIVREIDSTLKLQEDWEQFEYHFDAVHGDFLNRLRNDYPDLSPNEQKLCALLRLNLNTKEVSNLLGISVRGVEVARYRLRRKLGLDRGQNLSKFILEY